MKKRIFDRIKGAGLLLGLSLCPSFGQACGFHSIQPAVTNIPGTQHLTVRAFLAERNGVIQTPEDLSPEANFQRAAWWLRLLSRQLDTRGNGARHILLVDIPMWSTYDPDQQTPLLQLETQAADPKQPIMLLTHASLAAIASDSLSIEDAIAKRLMVMIN
ncbi:hypothetical protein [Vibrio sp. WXL103]|uniref:hypothetical protein n=1 Tax=Vibrio sp. WXL103 TaxID=3450710 RepID=UPI003EC824DE